MADIVLKNVHGEDKTFSGVSVIRVNTTDGGTEEFVPISAQTEYYDAGYSAGHADGYSNGYNKGLEDATPTLQIKTATPSISEQTISADADYDGLSEVIVEAMQTTSAPEILSSVDAASGKVTITAIQGTGYVEGGETIKEFQLDTHAGGTYTENQTINTSGKFMTGDIVVECPIEPKVNSITTSGTYDSATYHGAYYAAIDANGNLLVCVIGGTSTSYESIYFTAASLPDGVSLVKQSYYSYASMTASMAYVSVYSGITNSVDIALDFRAVNSTNDYVTCSVTITYV